MSDLLYNAMHWRHRAEESRTLAETMKDADARRIMLELAADFDKLAERAEERRASITDDAASAPEKVWRVRPS